MINQTIKLLLIEDSPSDAALIQHDLRAAQGFSFEIVQAIRLDEAITKLHETTFDIILLDLGLPDSSGLSTVRRIMEEGPRLPIVVLTGAMDEAAGIEAIRLGVQDYLVKGSTDGKTVVRVIRYAIERWHTEEALYNLNERITLAARAANLGIWDWDIQQDKLVLNDRMYELYGIQRDDFDGSYNALFNAIHPDDLGQSPKKSPDDLGKLEQKDYDTEYRVIWPDKSVHYLKAYGQVITDTNGVPQRMLGINYDITTSKQAEQQIIQMLEEKELLLQEVHHRVKNNMITFFALISLQLKTITDPSAIASLQDTASRVTSMIKLYDRLNQSGSYNEISIKEYLPSLVDDIVGSFPNGNAVRIEKNIRDFSLSVRQITPLGLVVSELLTNSMKYAFIGRDNGRITIGASQEGTCATIIIQDDGNGIPETVDIDNPSGFGLSIVKALVKQLQGSIQLERHNGTRFVLTFNIDSD